MAIKVYNAGDLTEKEQVVKCTDLNDACVNCSIRKELKEYKEAHDNLYQNDEYVDEFKE